MITRGELRYPIEVGNFPGDTDYDGKQWRCPTIIRGVFAYRVFLLAGRGHCWMDEINMGVEVI